MVRGFCGVWWSGRAVESFWTGEQWFGCCGKAPGLDSKLHSELKLEVLGENRVKPDYEFRLYCAGNGIFRSSGQRDDM